MWDPHVDGDIIPAGLFDSPHVYFIGTQHKSFLLFVHTDLIASTNSSPILYVLLSVRVMMYCKYRSCLCNSIIMVDLPLYHF